MTPEYIRSRINYDPLTGTFSWASHRQSRYVGKPFGSLNWCGYLRVGVHRKNFELHRLAWLCFYGEWPPSHIDHIDGDRTNNRIINLRLATVSQNAMNRKPRGKYLKARVA